MFHTCQNNLCVVVIAVLRKVAFEGIMEGTTTCNNSEDEEATTPPPIPNITPISSPRVNETVESDTVTKKKKRPFVWPDNMIFELMNYWRLEPVLFNVKDPSYSDKTKRGMAMNTL